MNRSYILLLGSCHEHIGRLYQHTAPDPGALAEGGRAAPRDENIGARSTSSRTWKLTKMECFVGITGLKVHVIVLSRAAQPGVDAEQEFGGHRYSPYQRRAGDPDVVSGGCRRFALVWAQADLKADLKPEIKADSAITQ